MRQHLCMVALAEEYLAFRRKLGFGLQIEGAQLLRFARYADQIGHRGPLTCELAIRWAQLSEKASALSQARRLDILRRFARYRALFDSATEIPPEGLLGPSYRRIPPYIYSQEEIAALLQAAGQLGPVGGLRPHTYVTLFGLLASTGVRISEALRLNRADADLNSDLLLIRAGKFKKSRLVPLHPSTAKALRKYARHRDRYHPAAAAEQFFLTEHATNLKYWRALMTFISLRDRLGWKRKGLSRPPRMHDLRHSFVVRRLLGWYEQGVDVDQKMPSLATYLGHVKVSSTYWYLSAAPELLARAGSRFERCASLTEGGQS